MKIITISLILLFAAVLCSFESKEDCFKELYQISKKYNKLPDKNQIYYYKLKIKNIMRNESYEDSESEVEIIMDRSTMHFKSDEMEIYIDKEVRITFLPNRKKIAIHNSFDVNNPFKRMKRLLTVRDTILENSVILKCEYINSEKGGNWGKKIKLRLGDDLYYPQANAILQYNLDLNKDIIRNITIEYPSPYKVRKTSVDVVNIDFDYQTNELKKPVKSIFINNSNELKEEYKNYEFIDTRNKRIMNN